jgi:ProP effector
MTSQVEPQVKPHNVKEVVALLAEQFPLCFSLAGAAKPLKIGIFQDLAERLKDNPLVSKTMLRQALRVYTSSWRYLDAVKEGVHRIDLDGNDGDLIDLQQAEHAASSLAESKAKALEARKAKQAAERAKAKAAAAEAGVAPDAVKAPVKPAYKKPLAKSSAKPVKTGSGEKKSQPQVKPKPVEVVQELVTLAPGALVAGAKVLVKLGASPMPATVIEVVKQDVVVQLASGMVVKTHSGSLYQA